MKILNSLLGISCAAISLAHCDMPRQTAESSSDPGAVLFIDNCARCHLSTGAGSPAPGGYPAADIREFDKNEAELREIITNGFGKMPSFKDSISDENIAKIATYVATQIERHAKTKSPGTHI